MRITSTCILALGLVPLLAISASGALTLLNGGFDTNPIAGTPVYPDGDGRDRDFIFVPDNWYTGSTAAGSNEDGVYGPSNYYVGSGGWTDNGIAFWAPLAVDIADPDLMPDFDEDGYFYTSLGTWAGEDFVRIDGTAHRTQSWEPIGQYYGNFEVAVYFTEESSGFTPASDGVDIAASGTLIDSDLIDVSFLWGAGGTTWSFTAALEGVTGLDETDDTVWLRIGDGPDDLTAATYDLPVIDNLELSFRPPGDVDGDLDVDTDDADIIAGNFGKTVADFMDGMVDLEDGDLVDDDAINMSDFRAWRDGYPYTPIPGGGSGGSVSGGGSAVPEPASALLMGLGVALAALRLRQRRMSGAN